MEIYNDNLKDLLATEVTTLSIREDEFVSTIPLQKNIYKFPNTINIRRK